MIRINLSKNKEVQRLLIENRDRVEKVKYDNRVLEKIGMLLSAQAKENLERGGTGTVSYQLLKPATQRRKRKAGQSMKPLQGDGLLKESLSYEVKLGELSLTAMNYAKYHQDGGDVIPKRPIFSVERANVKDIQYIILNAIKNG